jgi:FKBP-type peptidyl-prolyl cis-trans isomerase (trigger factor)
MKTEMKKLDKLKRVLTVVIEGKDFLKEKNDLYKDLGKKLKVPGFRSGNTPIEVLEKHHGPLLKEEFLKKALPEYYRKALEKDKIFPAGMPNVYDVELTDDKLSFSAEFEVRPEIELKDSDYKGIKVKAPKIQVKKDDTKKVIDHLKEGVEKVIGKKIELAELAKWAGHPDMESLDEAAKAEVYIEKLRDRRRSVDDQVIKYLSKKITIDLPKSEVEGHAKQLINNELQRLASQGIQEADIEKYKGDLEGKVLPLAQEQIKIFYIFDAIAKKENINVEKQEDLGQVILGFLLSQVNYA